LYDKSALSGAMEDCSIVRVQQLRKLYRWRWCMSASHRLPLERSRRSRIGDKSSARYDGEMPDSDRWMSVATLKSTRWCTGNQCSWRSTGVKWSERRVP